MYFCNLKYAYKIFIFLIGSIKFLFKFFKKIILKHRIPFHLINKTNKQKNILTMPNKDICRNIILKFGIPYKIQSEY